MLRFPIPVSSLRVSQRVGKRRSARLHVNVFAFHARCLSIIATNCHLNKYYVFIAAWVSPKADRPFGGEGQMGRGFSKGFDVFSNPRRPKSGKFFIAAPGAQQPTDPCQEETEKAALPNAMPGKFFSTARQKQTSSRCC